MISQQKSGTFERTITKLKKNLLKYTRKLYKGQQYDKEYYLCSGIIYQSIQKTKSKPRKIKI